MDWNHKLSKRELIAHIIILILVLSPVFFSSIGGMFVFYQLALITGVSYHFWYIGYGFICTVVISIYPVWVGEE